MRPGDAALDDDEPDSLDTTDEDPSAEPAGDSRDEDSAGWGRARRFGFAVLAIYFTLYALPFPLSSLPTWAAWSPRLGAPELPPRAAEALAQWDAGLQQASALTTETWNTVVPWVGREVFDHEVVIQPTGSGDTAFNYLRDAIRLALALLLAPLVLFVLGREPPRWLQRLLVVGVRYLLAFAMLGYGFFKVIKSQFPDPSLGRLLQPYGESSPMGLVWTFMGASEPYNWFTGGGEVLAGVLLLWRRTTTLGALVSIGVMANVAALNYAYDVPVKLYSTQLLLMGVALALLDGRRLANVFLRNAPAEPFAFWPPIRCRVLWVLKWLLKLVLVVSVVWADVDMSLGAYRMRGGAERPELYGIWDVEVFERAGRPLPPLTTDAVRWKRLLHDFPGYDGSQSVQVERMDGTRQRFGLALGEAGPDGERTFELTPLFAEEDQEPPTATLTLTRPAEDRLVLEGTFEEESIRVELLRRLPEDFLLVNRGFHWINELPFNR